MEGKKGIFSRVLIALCILIIIIYTVVITINFLMTGQEPSTTTISVYAFFGSELGFLAAKRIICGQKAAASVQPGGYGGYGGGGYGDLGGEETLPTDG
jgi:hypothetical protein